MCPETDYVSNDHSLAPLRSGRLPSQSRTDFPADNDEKGRGGVLRFVILVTTVGVRLDLIAVIVPSSVHKAMHCTAYPSACQSLKPENQKETLYHS